MLKYHYLPVALDTSSRNQEFDKLLHRRKSGAKVLVKNQVQLGELFMGDRFLKGSNSSIALNISRRVEHKRIEHFKPEDNPNYLSPDTSNFNTEVAPRDVCS